MENGQKLTLGTDAKLLSSISFAGGIAATPNGDKLMVIMELNLQNLTNPTPEPYRVAIPAAHMGNLAALFAQKAAEVQKLLEPAPGAKQ